MGFAPAVSLALDPADRAFYAGFDDGSIQLFDFFKDPEITNSLYDYEQSSIPVDSPPSHRWTAPSQNLGAALSLAVNYEGTKLYSGHGSGKVISWDIAKGRFSAEITNLASAVTNLSVLPPTGFPNAPEPRLKVHKVIKPNYDTRLSGHGANASGTVPAKYALTAQFTSILPTQRVSATETLPVKSSEFDAALTHPSFPTSMLEEGIAELANWNDNSKSSSRTNGELNGASEFITEQDRLRKENKELWELVGEQRRVQKRAWEKLIEWGEERAADQKRVKDSETMKDDGVKRRENGASALITNDNDMLESEMSEGDGNEFDAEVAGE